MDSLLVSFQGRSKSILLSGTSCAVCAGKVCTSPWRLLPAISLLSLRPAPRSVHGLPVLIPFIFSPSEITRPVVPPRLCAEPEPQRAFPLGLIYSRGNREQTARYFSLRTNVSTLPASFPAGSLCHRIHPGRSTQVLDFCLPVLC